MAARMIRPFRHSIAVLLVALPAASQAADSAKLRSHGKALLQQHCIRCHAIGATGDSPLKQAPPMRTIYGRFAPRELQAELREGLVSRHREMPQIDFSDEDTDAILAYLYTLAAKK
jgi:cytochrome c